MVHPGCGLGIEIQHHGLAAQIGKRDFRAVVGLRRKSGALSPSFSIFPRLPPVVAPPSS